MTLQGPARFAPPLLLALLLIFLESISGMETPFFLAAASATAFSYLVFAFGRILLAIIGQEQFDPNSAYALGLIATCLGVYALTLVIPGTAATALGVLFAIVIALEIALWRRMKPLPLDLRTLTGFALCVGFTAAWCHAPAAGYDVVRTEGFLPVWTDYFIHGALISQFGDVRAAGHQFILLADFPSVPYHYASYMAAAAFAGMFDQPGLPIAVSIWTPLGFLAMVSGAFVLGNRLAGPVGGLAALAIVAVLPDASNYGLRNGILSFHWQIFAHPGGTYALGAAFLSVSYLDRWSDEGRKRMLIASALVALSTFVLRVHIFVLLLPAWIATLAYCQASAVGRRRTVLWSAALLTLVAAVGGVSSLLLEMANPDATFGGPAMWKFLRDLHMSQEPTAYDGLYATLMAERPELLAVSVGVLLAAVGSLGVFAALFPVATALANHYRHLKPMDVFPGYVAFCWFLLLFFAPVTRAADESTDLVERPIVLLYAIAGIWTACLFVRALGSSGQPAIQFWRLALLTGFGALPVMALTAEWMERPKFRWGEAHVSHRLEAGVMEVAAHLRRHATAGDVFATEITSDHVPFDLPTILCSLTGLPTYLSRPYMWMATGGARKEEAAKRLAALNGLENEETYLKAMHALGRLPIRWYVTTSDGRPRWDREHAGATLRFGNAAVYQAR